MCIRDRRIHRWARRYGLRGGGTERPTVLNSWEGVYFTFTEKVLHGMMKRAADLGKMCIRDSFLPYSFLLFFYLSYICHITRNDHHDRHGHPTLIHEF